MEDSHSLFSIISHPYTSGLIYAIIFFTSLLVAASVVAFTSTTQSQIDSLSPKKSRKDRVILSLLDKKERLFVTLLIAKALLTPTVIGITIFEISKYENSKEWFWLIIIPLALFTYLIFELIPSKIARRHPIQTLHNGVYIVALLNFLLRPVSSIIIQRRGSYKKMDEMRATMEELPNSIHMDNNIVTEDKAILTGLSRFVNTEVADIMSPRIDIVSLNATFTLQNIKDIVLKTGFSRYPVYTDEIDNIKGVLHIKDLIAHVDNPDFQWLDLIREPYFVTEEKKINDLLEEFQSQKLHLAIVVDEYGSMQGVISLEDIIEEVVGEISDESDKEKPIYQKLEDNIYLFDGKSHIADFLRVFNLEDTYFDEYRGEAESLAGMMLEVNRDFLPRGARIKLGKYLFIVEALNSRRISKIKIIESDNDDV